MKYILRPKDGAIILNNAVYSLARDATSKW